MKIFFNYTIFFNQRYGGISRYFTCLIKELIKNEVDVKIVSPIFKNIYLNQIPKKNRKGIYIKRFPPLRIFETYNDLIVKNFIKNWNPEIIHDTYYSKNLLSIKNSKKIITVYDLIHEKFSKLYSPEKLSIKSKILENADHCICISKKTQEDLVNHYNISKNKTTVVYLGCDHFDKNKLTKNKKIFSKPFVLFVGSRNKYKNFKIIPEAFSLSQRIKDNFDIVCFGENKFSKDEIKVFNDLKFREDQIHHINGDDNLLQNLYCEAEALIFPSLYEGFGLPLVEAMKMGCPVISSNKGVMPEICRDAAEYFDPNNSNELIYVIEKILYSKENRNYLIEKGFSNILNYTWEKCAENTIEVYKKFV